MNLKKIKLDLPKRWQETSRSGNENQIYIWLNHISPLTGVDPKIRQDQTLPSSSENIIITKVGVPIAGSPPIKEIYGGLIEASRALGLYQQAVKIEGVYKTLTTTPGFERPGESDFSADISITQYQTAQIAEQSFKNMALMPTKGFNVPLPGGVQIPGMPKGTTFTELLESDIYEKYMPEHLEKMKAQAEKYASKEQLKKMKEQIRKVKELVSKEQLEKMRTAIREVQKETAKIKQDFSKSGIEFREGKYLGCRAIYVKSENSKPESKPKPALPSRKTSFDTGMGTGGGGYTVLDPLPKISRPSQGKIIYQAILVKDFIVTGSLLWMVASLPPGNTPCYSLTRTKTKTHIDWVEGEKYKYIDIVPIVSNIAQEGYFYKEEVEGIIKKIITVVSGFQN